MNPKDTIKKKHNKKIGDSRSSSITPGGSNADMGGAKLDRCL